MKLWRKNKRVEKELPSFFKAGLIKLNWHLHRLASFLQHRTDGYSPKKKKVLLLLFIIVFAAESILIIFQSLTRKCNTSIAITRIKPLALPDESTQNFLVTQKEFLKIQGLKNYIDSLSTTAKGRRLRDSLLHNRPHLMDSVNFLIKLYLEQSKTKQ